MKYKRTVYTQILLIITAIDFTAADEEPRQLRTSNPRFRPERFLAIMNTTPEYFHQGPLPRLQEPEVAFESAPDFPSQISQCLAGHRHQITDDFVRGKHLILNCFKGTLMLNMLRRLGESPKSSIKLFDGVVELKKIPRKNSDGCGEDGAGCEGKHDRNFQTDRKNEYIEMYRKAMEKLINERKKFNAYRNLTREEKAAVLEKINQNSQAFLSEIVRALGDEKVERAEEEKLKREIADPKLLSVLDTFSRNYMLKFRFYPGVAARMMRSHNGGGFTFDLEIQDSPEEMAEEVSSDESLTREIKDGPQPKDYFDDDDDDGGSKKKRKSSKKKKKQIKKKAKELKKIIPYLLLPMLIQMTLLPFVFKKLFFLAMKALFAGKMALILVGFNLLRNTCIKNDDDYQKIRVEHYGYKKGEEYGAWINGRSLPGPSVLAALSEEPFRGHDPLRGEVSS